MHSMKPVDVLIVGGGAVGLACAHYLVQAGREVCVIERDTVGSGASHGNCGLVVASYLLPLCAPGVVRKELRGLLRPDSPLYIKPALDLALWSWLAQIRGPMPPGVPAGGRARRANASWGARTDCSRRCFGTMRSTRSSSVGGT